MKLEFVYGLLPVLVHFTDNIKDGFGGMAYGPYVKLRLKYREDEGLLQHELTHAKQWYRTIGTHGIWYLLFERYRLQSEIEAYAVQAMQPMNWASDPTDWMADAILAKYNITSYTKEYVVAELKSRIATGD